MATQTKIALVTGGSRGLGKNMALRLADKGLDVIITYQSRKEDAEQVVKEISGKGRKAAALQLDLGDPKGLEDFLSRVQTVLKQTWACDTFDYLINNAGMGATIPIAQMTEADFDRFVNVHFKSVYFLCQKGLAIMNDKGGIVNISSGTTRFVNPGYSIYASMKSALETFSRYLAKEIGVRGIRVNVVAPGAIETDFNNAAIRSNPQIKAMISSLTALGRVGEADDIGGVVAFLCTDDARWVNGQRIEVSGGMNL
jgi:NAD(P)-dependent dehydrogenase (short-subunit alcohol dehydrogenase family)